MQFVTGRTKLEDQWLHSVDPAIRLSQAPTQLIAVHRAAVAEEPCQILGFGSSLTLSRLLWYGYTNADFLTVGRYLGASALGLYSMSWNLAQMPWAKLWFTTVNPMILPLFTRLRQSQAPLGPALCKLSRYTAFISFPAVVGLAAVADDAIPVTIGQKWADVIVPLRWCPLPPT